MSRTTWCLRVTAGLALMLAWQVQAADAPTPAAVEAQVAGLKDKDPLVRLKAARTLATMGAAATAAAPMLEQMKNDPDEDVRTVAARALASIRADVKSRVDALAEYLGDSDPLVRTKAARELGNFAAAARPALPALRKLLKDEDEPVRKAAQAAIDRIGAPTVPPAVQGLIHELQTGDMPTRLAAIEALGQVGKPAKGALETLRAAGKDPEAKIRIAALKAIAMIEAAVAADKELEPIRPAEVAGVYTGAKFGDAAITEATWKKRVSRGGLALPDYPVQPAAAARGKVAEMFENARWTINKDGDLTVQLVLPVGWGQGFDNERKLTFRGPLKMEKNTLVFSLSTGRPGNDMWLNGDIQCKEDEPILTVNAQVTLTGENLLTCAFHQDLEPVPAAKP